MVDPLAFIPQELRAGALCSAVAIAIIHLAEEVRAGGRDPGTAEEGVAAAAEDGGQSNQSHQGRGRARSHSDHEERERQD